MPRPLFFCDWAGPERRCQCHGRRPRRVISRLVDYPRLPKIPHVFKKKYNEDIKEVRRPRQIVRVSKPPPEPPKKIKIIKKTKYIPPSEKSEYEYYSEYETENSMYYEEEVSYYKDYYYYNEYEEVEVDYDYYQM